jgi:hypothetical protein
MKIALAMMTALALSACVSGARYKGAARSAAPEATAPSPFGRNIDRGVPVFTDQAGNGKVGQQ